MSDYFIFGDIDTRDYEGIYVYFDDIDATPSRVGEFIEIPGRNGSFYLDKGRYEDVTHTYDIVALTMEAGRDLINAISSQVGYHRLEDSFNPDEFYSAVFTSEVDPNVPTDREQMTFKLMFTRKPQRFLTSGETARVIHNIHETLPNPTLFESSPLLTVNGYGSLSVNGYDITLNDEVVGHLELLSANNNASGKQYFSTKLLATGDTITLNGGFSVTLRISVSSDRVIDSFAASRTETHIPITPTITSTKVNDYTYDVKVDYAGDLTFTKGNGTDRVDKVRCTLQVTHAGTTYSAYCDVNIIWEANGSTNGYIWPRSSRTDSAGAYCERINTTYGELTAESTQSVLGNPTYIDCDLGEAYKIVDGEMASLNQYIELGSELPKLVIGDSTFTFDNTITQLKVTPRWWKI